MRRPYSTNPRSIAWNQWRDQAKASGRPSYFATLARSTAWQWAHRAELALIHANRRAFGDYYGPLVACCRQWRRVDQVPFTAPCCGTVYFEELSHVSRP